jgi:hypothetical protein
MKAQYPNPRMFTMMMKMLWVDRQTDTTVYPKVSVLAAWSKNCKWYSSLQQVAVVSLFCESV